MKSELGMIDILADLGIAQVGTSSDAERSLLRPFSRSDISSNFSLLLKLSSWTP